MIDIRFIIGELEKKNTFEKKSPLRENKVCSETP